MPSNIQERFAHLVRRSGEPIQKLANESGIDYRRWVNVLNGRARLTADFIEFAAQKWVIFSLWLVLGEKFENDEVCINDLVSPSEFDKEQTSWKLESLLDDLQKQYQEKTKEEISELIEKISELKKK
ncbi:hypothetical protein [Marinobacter arenosus]|uniref:hypothetical protein n=1 Tax=Marinobacter arenosus TaxID=2856822 RepID=UPI001C4AD2B1|nr:hypothetical protein [Marinobacter arenosus]MBW0147510.1 hypothetical protein [Marinobacter arenosus]